MNCDFYRYNPNLDLDALAARGVDALLEELRFSRGLYESLNSIFEDSLDGFFVTDGEGKVLKVNRSYQEMSGLPAEEILGKNVRDLEGWGISTSASIRALEANRAVTIEQEYIRTKRFAYITSTPIYDADGKAVMVVSNNRDFREIERLKGQLDEAQKLASQYEEKLTLLSEKLVAEKKVIAEDPATLKMLYRAARVAETDTAAILMGESGTGKEVIAQFIHRNSARSAGPFYAVNCAAISPELMESEFFGYEKGAFTGASPNGKIGIFEAAAGGTLFLDEIGEMPLGLQSKLLRVLQEQEFVRVGGTQTIATNVRIISATNQNVADMIERRQFRADLYYRLGVVAITVAPLRERRMDITALADFFLARYNAQMSTEKVLTQSAYNLLKNYHWPGNIRELKNVIELMVIMSEGNRISSKDLMLHYSPLMMNDTGEESVNLKTFLERIEFQYISKCYRDTGSLRLASEKLGMNLKTLSRRKKYLEGKYGLNEG